MTGEALLLNTVFIHALLSVQAGFRAVLLESV